MNLQHLRYFVTLASLEHYTKAAEQLHITQPTLSHAISMLEEELGIRLFEKKGRNIALTDNGKLFNENIKKALKMIDDSITELQAQNKASFDINIALLRTMSHQTVPNLLRSFIDKHPNSTTQFIFHNDSGMSYDMLNGLVEEKYDLAFCSKIDSYKDIIFLPVAIQDLVLIVPKEHPLTKKKTVTLEDTLDYTQIWFSKRSGMRPVLNDLYQDYLDKIDVAFEVEEDETIVGLVAQNFGIAILPRFDFLKMADIEVIEIDALKGKRILYMAYKKNQFHSPALKEFISFVENSIEDTNS